MPTPRRLLSLAQVGLAALALAACGAAGGVDTTGETTGGEPPDTGTTASPTTAGPLTGTTTTPDTDTGETGTPDPCGDGVVDGDEVCDGAELGGKTCADVDDAFVGGELACAADCASFDASGCEVDPASPLVALNEVLSKSALAGPHADMGDALELYNAGGAEADLSGWKLSDDPDFPPEKTYVFPGGTVLAPGAWLVLVELDAMSGDGHLPFGISSDSEETLTLADAEGLQVDQVVVAGADAVVSYCRLPDGTGAWQTCDQTLGAANLGPSAECGNAALEPGEDCDGDELGGQTCEGLGLGFVGGTLACTDGCSFDASMCESGGTVAVNELESTEDRIEIHNAGGAEVDLSGWVLTDDEVGPDYDPALDPEKLEFPPQTVLAAGGFLVVEVGMRPGQHPFGLGAAGDTVSLLRPTLEVVDQVTYGPDEAVVSYCRVPDGPAGAWTVGCVPTFGAANEAP